MVCNGRFFPLCPQARSCEQLCSVYYMGGCQPQTNLYLLLNLQPSFSHSLGLLEHAWYFLSLLMVIWLNFLWLQKQKLDVNHFYYRRICISCYQAFSFHKEKKVILEVHVLIFWCWVWCIYSCHTLGWFLPCALICGDTSLLHQQDPVRIARWTPRCGYSPRPEGTAWISPAIILPATMDRGQWGVSSKPPQKGRSGTCR